MQPPAPQLDVKLPLQISLHDSQLQVAVGISPSFTSHSMGLSHQVEEYWTTLIKGANLIKCGRRGQPHIHFFRLSESQDSLIWESKGRLRRVPLVQVRKILQGQQTQVFLRNRGNPTARGLDKMSMSLIYGHRQEDRTLDVMCQSEEEFNLWYHALKYVTDHIRSRSQVRPRDARVSAQVNPPSLHGGGQSQGFVNQNLGFPASGNIPGDCYIWGAAPDTPPSLKQSGLELLKVTSPHLVPSSQKLDLIYVACGPSHFTAVTRSGNLYSWGSGEHGKLGLGSAQHVPIPNTVPKLRGVIAVSCGDSTSAAITAEGDLYTWGSGMSGQLGHGNTVTQYLPKRVTHGFGDIKIRHVSCGPFHSAAISEGGGVFTWGDGFAGKLGHGDETTLLTPKRMEGLTDVVHVSCGWWHTAAVSRVACGGDYDAHRMALYTWGGQCTWEGDSNKGCLGNGKKTGEWLPTLVEGALASKNVKTVACGLNLTVAVTRDGGVYQMGATAAEDTFLPWEGANTPTRVEGPLKRIYADQVACGKQHVVVVGSTAQSRSSTSDKKHHVFAWGTGKRGQLGLGSHKDHTTPQFIEDLGPRKVVNVCCGGDYTLIVCSHDHKAAAANTTEMLISPTSDYSPTSSAVPRRSTTQSTSSSTVVSVNQLRLTKKSALNHRDGVGSLDHISLASSSSSIRKMKSDVLFSGARLDRTRTGSTPMSDVPSEQRTPHAIEERRSATGYNGGPRSSTPTSLAESHEAGRHASVPDLTANDASMRSKFDPTRPGDAESIVSDPCERGDESSSDDDASVANTDGQFTHDAYSEEETSVHRSAPSFSERTTEMEQPGLTKLHESFRLPIMPFPPSADAVPVTSTRSLSRSVAAAARIRTRQRGLERRLGITDTWTSDKLISKQASTPGDVDLLSTTWSPAQTVIQEEGSQTARELRSRSSNDPRDSQRHRRTTSEQNLYLNSLRESLKNVGDSKTKILNYGKLLESVEERLVTMAAKQKGEVRDMDPELMSVIKLLDADENQNQIGSFFEAATVEKTFQIVKKLSELLESTPSKTSTPTGDQLKCRLLNYEQLMTQVRELICDLKKALGVETDQTPTSTEPPPKPDKDSTYTTPSVPAHSTQEASVSSVHMWMEKVDPGVSIVFQSAGGTTKIKKIRFAKRMFAWDEAQRWWEENQDRLITDYNLEPGFDPMNQSASES